MFFAQNFALVLIFVLFAGYCLNIDRFFRIQRRRLLGHAGLNALIIFYWLGWLLGVAYFAKIVIDFILLNFSRTKVGLWIFFVVQLTAVFTYKYFIQPVGFGIVEIGISFHLLFAMRLAIQTNRGLRLWSFRDHILVFSFFPTFLSGPLTDPTAIRKHIYEPVSFRVSPTVLLFFIGLLKVALNQFIAGTIPTSIVENVIYYNLLFFFELSGYSDMAIAFGRFFGIGLNRNFDQPLLKTSISKMWASWHISLAKWFEENVYMPLQYSRILRPVSPLVRHRLLILFTFFLIGMWHSVSWNFALWGLGNGLFAVTESFFSNKATRKKNWLILIGISYVWIVGGLLRWITALPVTGLDEFSRSLSNIIRMPVFLLNFESLVGISLSLIAFALTSVADRWWLECESDETANHFLQRPVSILIFATAAIFVFAVCWFERMGTFVYGGI